MPPKGHGMYERGKRVGTYGNAGPVEEDGSRRVAPGRTYDPDTGRVRRTKSPRWDAKAKRWR